MANFNGKKLKGASNLNNVSIDVGLVFIRAAGSNGEYVEVPSTSNLQVTLDGTTIADISSESRGTAIKLADLGGNITFDLTENAGINFMAKALGLDVTSNAAGTAEYTDKEMKFEGDTIEFKELSNDGLGFTGVSVKDSTGTTTYVEDTDYTIVLDGNITRLVIIESGAITENDKVLVTGSANVNANESTTYTASYTQLPTLDIRVIVEKTTNGVAKYRRIEGDSMTLNSTYVFPFLDAVDAGSAQNTSLQFDLDDDYEFNIVNEIL